MTRIAISLEKIRKCLVERGTRSRLIHVNRDNRRAKVINLKGERSQDIYKILCLDSKKMRFNPKGTEEENEDSVLFLIPEEDNIDEEHFTDLSLDTPLSPSALQKKLFHIFSAVKTAEEEQGVNILYLAMGFLKWVEPRSKKLREAPLILVPVELVRNQKTSSFDVRRREESIETNLSLQERLKDDFKITLPEIEEEQKWSPIDYFAKVKTVIKRHSDWKIDQDGMQIGLFSFAKLLMFKDLEPDKWSDNALIENPIIKGLLSDGFKAGKPFWGDGENLDKMLSPSDTLHVIDADASQTKIIEAVRKGRNLVVQGPPGTGKSQTIVNILSVAAYDGKTVLFVAEKMAALNVVYRRMEKLGLKDLCLELHSKYANKKSFLKDMASTLKNSDKPNEKEDYSATVQSLGGTRGQLNDIADLLHTPLEDGYSPYEILVKLIHFEEKDIKGPFFEPQHLISKAEEKRILKALEDFCSLLKENNFSKHPYRGATEHNLDPDDFRLLHIKEAWAKMVDMNKLFVASVWEQDFQVLRHRIDLASQNLFRFSVYKIDLASQNLFKFSVYKKICAPLESFLKGELPEKLEEQLKLINDFIKVKKTITEVSDKLGFKKTLREFLDQLPLMKEKNDYCYYEVWVKYSEKRLYLEKFGLSPFLTLIEEGKLNISKAKDECGYTLYKSRWKKAKKQKPQLADYVKVDRHELSKCFREYDKKSIMEAKTLIKNKHLKQIPKGHHGEIGYLREEICKKKRHRSIRHGMEKASSMIQRIKPIFLMSPISVAQFLPPQKLHFDLLVIDEASQVKPEDALGSIARAKQIVVVGDQKQLPPTSFFERLTNDNPVEDEDDEVSSIGDMESILSLCEAKGIEKAMFKWHYRSEDPSLIAVSNAEFYDGELIVPPCPKKEDSFYGLKFKRVPGSYSRAGERGRSGTNRIEAEHIVNRVSELAISHPTFSLGVATCSSLQADIVNEMLELKRRTDPVLKEALGEKNKEPIFVKNIENIQGDERDVILISIGYGPDEPNGQLRSMRFGPINREGGERRLNVLFTRARKICEIFCSFDPNDIDLKRSKREGTKALKTFLQYAQNPSSVNLLKEKYKIGEGPDNEFEESIARVIRSMGYEVDYQVGTAGFRIDLGVKRRDGSHRYLLAVECDGATYHSSLWARERDRARQEILENKGWTFYRVWSTDWFYHKTEAISSLKEALSKSEHSEAKSDRKGANLPTAQREATRLEKPEESEDIPLPTPSYNIPKYVKADPKPLFIAKEPHEIPIKEELGLGEMLGEIVKTEGIIHIEEIARRYANAYQKTRVGKRILKKVKTAIMNAKDKYDLENRGDFWGSKEQFDSPPIRDRSEETGPLTKPKFLPEEEVIAAKKLIERESGTVGHEELIRGISKLLGFKRAGPDFRKQVGKILRTRDPAKEKS